jgi:hypothetical protein
LGRAGEPGGHHYNPNQPRVPAGDASHHGGQWTSAGGVTLASSAAAPAIGGAAVFEPYLAPALRALLASLAAGAAGVLSLAGGLILIPLNRGQMASGELPGHPDVRYRYDQGFLSVAQILPSGEAVVLFHGRPDASGLYVHANGAVIGRELDSGVFLSEASIKREKRTIAQTGAAVRAKDEVKFCPDPGPDRPSNANLPWRLYQMQITGLPMGIAVELNGVMFDGCDETRRVMLEAKGEGYEWALEGNDFALWYDGKERLLEQMKTQSETARGRIVEWHVAERLVADVLHRYAKSLGYPNVVVVHTPAVASPVSVP